MNRGLAVTAAVLTGGILLGYQNVTSSGARVEVLPPGGGAFAVEGYDPQRLNILGEGFVALADGACSATEVKPIWLCHKRD